MSLAPLSSPSSLPPVRLDANGRIDQDLPCVKCGYNLRCLTEAGLCPECATPVGRSLTGDYLRFRDPAWVATLASGMNWIVWGIIVGIGGGLLGGIAIGSLRGAGAPGVMFLLPFLQFGLSTISIVGYWKVTTPDPGRSGEEIGITARKLVRFAQISSWLGIPIGQVLESISGILSAVFSIPAGLLGLIGTFALYTYARGIAFRIPDEKLARSTRIVMWGMVVTLGFVFIAGVLGAIAAATVARTTPGAPAAAPPTGAMVGLGAAASFGGCGVLIFGIWSLLLIDRYRKALNEAALIARTTWAADVPRVAVGRAVVPPPNA